ncbi:hypothetical protein D3C73_1040490 [compost metagenome]
MHVHQAWHDKVIAGIDNAVTRLWLRRHGCRADVGQQAVFHDQRLLLTGMQASTVEQGLAFEVQGIHGVFTWLIVMQSEARVRPRAPPATCINGRVLMASIAAQSH